MFISNAYAQAAAAGAAGAAPAPGPGEVMGGMLPFIVLFAVLYFMALRPQSKKQKEIRAMLEALVKGDEVVTQGGVLGRITALDENIVTLQVADGVQIKVTRHSIAQVLPRGTLK
ncbi:MAG: preprotein translocase subunit YajC [Ottowia sp.]|nr:preprotein translocase subunit YajC [Ottowia sp.]